MKLETKVDCSMTLPLQVAGEGGEGGGGGGEGREGKLRESEYKQPLLTCRLLVLGRRVNCRQRHISNPRGTPGAGTGS